MEITRPENRFSKVLETAGTVVTVASVLGIIEIIATGLEGAENAGTAVYWYCALFCWNFHYSDRPEHEKKVIIILQSQHNRTYTGERACDNGYVHIEEGGFVSKDGRVFRPLYGLAY
jgi:hypothetical protein